MEAAVLQHFQRRLQEQHRNLTAWLSSSPAWKRRIRLGPVDERAVQVHLRTLDQAIGRAREKTLGVCEVCNEDVETGRLEMDYACCVCLDHLSPDAKVQLESELELSARVQQALLPQQVPEIPGLDLAAFYRPATIVGGDYFDFFRYRDGTHGLAIGDAVGHGMSASLLISYLLAALRLVVSDNDSPAEVLRQINALFYHNIHLTSFVSLFLGRLDAETSRLTFSSAGHNPALLFRPWADGEGRLSWLGPTGAAIGLVEEGENGESVVTLAPGDVLVLYTDGVTEATNPQGEEFGQDRLAELVWRSADRSSQELVGEIRAALHAFTLGRPLPDDTTVVAYRVVGTT